VRSSIPTTALAAACALVAAVVALDSPSAAQRHGARDAGLRVERIRLPRPPTVSAGDRILTLVRVDPRRYAFRFLSEGHEGPRRPLTQWVRDFGLTGGINAGMFLPDGRSVGFLMHEGIVRSHRHPSRFEAFLGFGRPERPEEIAVGGPSCGRGLGWFRERYRSVLQARRLLLSCEGEARPWPNRRRYSVAAFGVDEHGWAVLVHSRTPYRMSVFSEMLASLHLGLRGLAYMEGGPEASLVVETETERVHEVGSWEDGFNRNDDNRAFWDLPNIVGFAPRGHR